jgi:hypothetical protein
VTIEMGSLYASGDPAPPASGDLITLTVSGPCNVSITENVIRGGIVMEDPAVPANPSFTGCEVGGTACPCKGDSDGNQVVDTDDLNNLMLHMYINGAGDPVKWTSPLEPYPCMDTDGNQVLDTDDLNAVMLHMYINGASDPVKWTSPCMP